MKRITLTNSVRFLVHHSNKPIDISNHYHEGCEIYFFISGDAEYFVENKKYSLKCGDVMITREDEIHSPIIYGDGVYERIYIQFDPSLLDLYKTDSFNVLDIFYKRAMGDNNKITMSEKNVKYFWELLNKLWRVYRKKDGGTKQMLMDAYFYEILAFLYKQFYDHSEEVVEKLPDKLAPIIEYIDNNLDKDLSLTVLEKEFYMNRYYLCRIFKKNTNVSLHDFIAFKRVNRAKLLLTEDYSVTEVAQMCGFNDYSNFIRVFGRVAGISPGKFKKQYEENVSQ